MHHASDPPANDGTRRYHVFPGGNNHVDSFCAHDGYCRSYHRGGYSHDHAANHNADPYCGVYCYIASGGPPTAFVAYIYMDTHAAHCYPGAPYGHADSPHHYQRTPYRHRGTPYRYSGTSNRYMDACAAYGNFLCV